MNYANYSNTKALGPIDSEFANRSYAPDSILKAYKQYQKSLSDEELEVCIRLYSESASVYALAEKFCRHRTTIGHSLKNAGVEITHKAY